MDNVIVNWVARKQGKSVVTLKVEHSNNLKLKIQLLTVFLFKWNSIDKTVIFITGQTLRSKLFTKI